MDCFPSPCQHLLRFPSSRLVLARLKKKLDLKVWCVDVNPFLLARWQDNGVQRLFCLGARVKERRNINGGGIRIHPLPFHKNSMMGNSISLRPGKWKQVPRNHKVLPKSIPRPTGSGKPFPLCHRSVPRNKQVSFHIFVPHATCTTSWPSPRPLNTRAGRDPLVTAKHIIRQGLSGCALSLRGPFACVQACWFLKTSYIAISTFVG